MTEPINANLPTPDQMASPAPAPAPPAADGGDPAAEQPLAQLTDQLLRRAAEFENYKRRVEQESSGIIRMANEGLVRAILPIVDDLERSLKAGRDSQDLAAFYRGVELIAQKLAKVLESQGVRTFETSGKPFDVHYHDALMQVPNADLPPFTILEEVERGYTMHDKVIRHAKVVVSTPPEDANPEQDA